MLDTGRSQEGRTFLGLGLKWLKIGEVRVPQGTRRLEARWREIFILLQPLPAQLEGLKGPIWRRSDRRLVRGHQRVQLGLDHLFQLPDSGEVGVLPLLLLPVKNLLAIQVNFESAIGAGGERNPYVWPKGAKEFVRQPRGGCVVLSGHAVQDIYEHFPLAIGSHRPLLTSRLRSERPTHHIRPPAS
jgi:hypothetical protein